jgi:Raf kinase inhibitor-like YbhB/YbcL family protein
MAESRAQWRGCDGSAAMGSSNGTFHLESPAFRDGALIPVIHTGEGLNLSPPLRWSGAPSNTASYALVMDDPDAPGGTWVHWVLFNIPPQLRALPAGLERLPQLPNGARHGSCWGASHFERIGYQGPLPPGGMAHRYRFALHALDAPLDLEPGCTVGELHQAIAVHGLAQAQLSGVFASATAP